MRLDLFGARAPLAVDGWRGWADFGGDGEIDSAYRYELVREWKDGVGDAVFCMLNPSTATASENDRTVRRCMGYTRAWGMGQHGRLQGRDRFALDRIRKAGVTPYALKLSDDGTPWHPLYLAADLKPFPLEAPPGTRIERRS